MEKLLQLLVFFSLIVAFSLVFCSSLPCSGVSSATHELGFVAAGSWVPVAVKSWWKWGCSGAGGRPCRAAAAWFPERSLYSRRGAERNGGSVFVCVHIYGCVCQGMLRYTHV